MMNTKIYIIVGVVVLVLVGALAWLALAPEKPVAPAPAPTPVAAPANDSTTAIGKDLDAVDLGNLDQEFKDVDADLNAL